MYIIIHHDDNDYFLWNPAVKRLTGCTLHFPLTPFLGVGVKVTSSFVATSTLG